MPQTPMEQTRLNKKQLSTTFSLYASIIVHS